MIAVDQTIFDKGRGNCQQAVVASLLNLELCQVPHFRLFPESTWFTFYYWFLYAAGWKYVGYSEASNSLLEDGGDINGYFEACVPSKNYPPEMKITHAVIIDRTGLVVHDPYPGKKYQGENIIESGALMSWYLFEKVKE